MYYIMNYLICLCDECKFNNQAYYTKLLKDKLFGDVYCYHSWIAKIKLNKSKHKVNVSTDEKN